MHISLKIWIENTDFKCKEDAPRTKVLFRNNALQTMDPAFFEKMMMPPLFVFFKREKNNHVFHVVTVWCGEWERIQVDQRWGKSCMY